VQCGARVAGKPPPRNDARMGKCFAAKRRRLAMTEGIGLPPHVTPNSAALPDGDVAV